MNLIVVIKFEVNIVNFTLLDAVWNEQSAKVNFCLAARE